MSDNESQSYFNSIPDLAFNNNDEVRSGADVIELVHIIAAITPRERALLSVQCEILDIKPESKVSFL